MKSNIYITPIKKDAVQNVKDWFTMLNNELKKEATETLAEEGITIESGGVFEWDHQWYVAVYIAYENEIKSSDKSKIVNKLHEAIKVIAKDKNLESIEIYNIYNLGY